MTAAPAKRPDKVRNMISFFRLRAAVGAATMLFAISLAACGGGGGGAALPAIAASTSASATSGGPTATARHLTTLGDSITATYADPTVDATLYPHVLAGLLGATLTDLGISGEASGPVTAAYREGALAYGTSGGVLADEVPLIPLDTTIVTLYIGTNDVYEMGTQQAPDYSNTAQIGADTASAYATNVRAIVAGIHARVPNARIFAASVPDPAWRPISLPAPMIERSPYVTTLDAMRQALIGTGATLVDLMCEPAMYDDANFANPYDVHPLPSGHAVIAADFAAQIAHPTTPSSCKYQSP
ncbi:MAG: GDSL-like lipase/acylhydrolase domain protein [Candidatus Eremiobacteraeota bacterium]|nr:GDSL-like lipase/acylhydrolase domain protein [Candidatus Eremiobacteraeota bacterium]